MRPDLLQPSLQQNAPTEAPFSPRSMFLTSFFLGGVALGLLAWFNSKRIGKADSIVLVAGGIAGIVVPAVFIWFAPEFGFDLGGDDARDQRRILRRVNQAAALCAFGFVYLRQRARLSAWEMSGEGWANPWKVALSCGVVGIAISAATSILMLGVTNQVFPG